MKTLIISSSLNPNSRSRLLAKELKSNWENQNIESSFLNLADWDLPICNGHSVYGNEIVQEVKRIVAEADAYVIATPIYTYNVNAALKNLVELASHVMDDKYAGFLCAAGGEHSYMSIMSFANSLMCDFRVTVLPRFVYATGSDFSDDELTADISDRLKLFGDDFQIYGSAITQARKL